jgi:hypothetical protein
LALGLRAGDAGLSIPLQTDTEMTMKKIVHPSAVLAVAMALFFAEREGCKGPPGHRSIRILRADIAALLDRKEEQPRIEIAVPRPKDC